MGIAGGVLFQVFSTLVQDPIIRWLGLSPPSTESLEKLASGGWVGFAATLAIVWIVGGVMEEMAFRGYLLQRISDGVGGRNGAIAAYIISSLYFGLSHWYQGPAGVISALSFGLFVGVLFVQSGRNLLLPIIAHGVYDTAGIGLLALHVTGW